MKKELALSAILGASAACGDAGESKLNSHTESSPSHIEEAEQTFMLTLTPEQQAEIRLITGQNLESITLDLDAVARSGNEPIC